MKRKQQGRHIVVRVLDWEGVALTPLAAAMPSVETAVRLGSISGYAYRTGIEGYPNGGERLGRVWIEDRNQPAVALKDYERRGVR